MRHKILFLFVLLISIHTPVFAEYSSSKITAEYKECGCEKEKYTIYVGLNDKNTKKQEIAVEQAEELIRNICLKYCDGVTVLNGSGYYKHDDGTTVTEKTVVVILFLPDDKALNSICDEICSRLNQESVLLEKQKTSYTFHHNSH